MTEAIPSSPTLGAELQSSTARSYSQKLNLSSLPPIAVLSAHFKEDEEHEVENTLHQYGAPVTSDLSQVKVFIGKVGTKRRAEFELRCRKFIVQEITDANRGDALLQRVEPPKKKMRLSGSSAEPIVVYDNVSTTEDELDDGAIDAAETEDEFQPVERDTPLTSPVTPEKAAPSSFPLLKSQMGEDLVWVLKLDWLDACVAAGRLQPLQDYLVYRGRVLERPRLVSKTTPKSIKACFSQPTPQITPASRTAIATRPQTAQNILDRAKSDAVGAKSSQQAQSRSKGYMHGGSRRFEGASYSSTTPQAGQTQSRLAHLLQQTTSEYEGVDSDTPQPPEWVKKSIKYACQRFTPADGPNEDFICQLKKIRTARTLTDDEIGVRAYSTSIAAIAAYPHKLIHPREILQLPGCDSKIATLWVEWKNTGKIRAVEDFDNDESMKVLRTFYEIWGVGAKTARHFYYQNHWTELDDIVEFGWNDLDRVQQIGLKYYDEFLDGIPRAEVEQIAAIVRDHAVKLRDERVTVTIVGGYRRGKAASGDVDMIVSHPDLDATANLVRDMVESLEQEEWITHTLSMSLNNTHRGQATLPFHTTKASGAGFDTLDKALVVWQDPQWPTKKEDLEANPKAKNPNIHRRVDIIISPWRTVGCAVMGWSGGTTFQRDLRRYAKYAKGWKFDSSGIRSRSTGEVMELEGPEGIVGTPEEAEQKVFEGLGLEYIPPDQRCTN